MVDNIFGGFVRYRVSDLVNEDATLISRRCWSDEGVYELEKRGIFGKSWLFLGHETQIKNAGDFVQADREIVIADSDQRVGKVIDRIVLDRQ